MSANMTLPRYELTEEELEQIYKPKSELIVIALNRKYPQDEAWKASKRHNGDIRFEAGEVCRIVPAMVFYHTKSVVDLWDWIERYWNLS